VQLGYTSLSGLALLRNNVRSERVSSWDTLGGNRDFWLLPPGAEKDIFNITGAGCIKHIWMTMSCSEPAYVRKIVLRAWWDDEDSPSIECPIGDFFGIGHGIIKNFWSLPLQMSPENGRGFNCWFPMPFRASARIEVTNETNSVTQLYFYIDYESYPSLNDEYGRFHTQWRRENPTHGWGDDSISLRDHREYQNEVWNTPNLNHADNYLILDAEGKGQYVGCHLDVDCLSPSKNRWWGEGDDMILIDGENWPPRLHGTGSEDYFNTAYCPTQEFYSPYHGLTVYSGSKDEPWKGKNSVFRYHIEDPIYFERSILVTIEHGHANNLTHDYSSTAYWYQTEPHKPFPAFPPMDERVPRPDLPSD
jgi:hypothetical protein